MEPHLTVQVGPVLLRELLVILDGPQYPPSVQRRAVAIVHAVVNMCSIVSGQHRQRSCWRLQFNCKCLLR